MTQMKAKLDESICDVEVCRERSAPPSVPPLVQEVAVSGAQEGDVQEKNQHLQSVELTAPDVLAWLLERIGSFMTGNIFIPEANRSHLTFQLEGSLGLLCSSWGVTEKLAPESSGTEPLLKGRNSQPGESVGIRPRSRRTNDT